MNSRPLILASNSPRRKELLAVLGVPFEVVPSAARELAEHASGPRELVRSNAKAKAEEVAARYPERWVLGADTVVCLNRRVFGKPADRQQAQQMLDALQGKTHRVFTGLCLLRGPAGDGDLWHEETLVTFRSLSAPAIRDYLERIDPLDKAGAYAIQEGGERIVGRIEGSLSNVVGLPLESLEARMVRHGIL